jgi:plasmid stability protein
MANLSIRKLDQKIYEKLHIRAAKHGVSMEEEVRQIITQAVAAPDQLGELFKQYFGASNGVDLELPSRGDPHDPLDLN